MARVTASSRSDRRAFSLARRSAFYVDMFSFLDANIPPYQAIERMESIARRQRKTRGLANVFRRVLRAMNAGKSVADAIAPFVPGSEAVMLVGSHQAGPDVLRKTFGELAVLLDRQHQARAALRKVLIGNLVSIAAIVGVMGFIMTQVAPRLTSAITPEMSALMVFAPGYFAFGRAFVDYGAYVAILAAGLTAFVAWSLPRWKTSHPYVSRHWFDRHLMPWSLYARTQATFFLSGAAAMMRSGIPLRSVVSDMLPYASPWLSVHLRRVVRDLERGRPEVESLRGGILPVDTADRLSVYALMDDFTGIMTRLAEDNFKEFESAIEAVGAVLKLVSLLLLALFAGATLVAMFDYSDALQTSMQALRNGL